MISDQWGVLSQEWGEGRPLRVRCGGDGKCREVKSKRLTASTMITSETSRERKMIIMRTRESIKVLIADDHDLTRLGLKILISQQQHC